MLIFLLVVVSSLLAPGADITPGSRCSANHTQLFLFVDLVHQERRLTVTRIKNIVTYFTTKVKDGIIRTLDVSLVDPVQQNTLFNLTNVRSGEIISAIDQLLNTTVEPFYNDITNFEYLKTVTDCSDRILFHEPVDINNQQSIVVFLLHFFDSFYRSVKYLISKLTYPHFLMIILISVTSKIESEKYTTEYLNYKYVWYTNETNDKVAIVHAKNDFNLHNRLILYLCKDCPEAWTRYNWGGPLFSCYFVNTQVTPISWMQAAKSCSSLESTLPNIETEDEFILLKDRISNKTMTIQSTNHSTTGISITTIVNVGLIERHELYHRYYLWTNLRPFLLKTSVDTYNDSKDHCVALNFYPNDIKLMKINCDQPKSKILVCEMEGGQIDYTLIQQKKFHSTLKSSLETEVSDWTFKTLFDETLGYPLTKFVCQKDVHLISYDSVCDGDRDCSNGRDEEFCNTVSRRENPSIFLCTDPNGVEGHPTMVSISIDQRCNLIQDCPDNSDELGCDGCLDKQCGDGTCVPSHWLSHDSQECHLFIAANGTAYLNVSYDCQYRCNGSINFNHEITFCNTNINLDDYSVGQTLYNNISSGVQWAPKCIYLKGSGGGPMGCQNKNHLRDCKTFVCPEGFLKCVNSYCIPWHYSIDEILDCPLGEDKEFTLGLTHYFDNICSDLRAKIHLVNLCDGVQQCLHNEDENDCPMICPPGFKCRGRAVQVRDHTQVKEITSLNIFDINTKFLNVSGVDLSNLNKVFIFRNLLEIHASNCSIVHLNIIFDKDIKNKFIFAVNLSYNKLSKIFESGPLASLMNLQFLNLSHNEQLSEIQYEAILSRKLQSLDLSFTGISSLSLRVLETGYNLLRHLNLRHTKLAEIGSFTKIKSLEFLNLENTSLVPKNMTEILKYVTVSSAIYVDNYKFCCPQISTGGTPKHACHAPPVAISSCEDLLSDVLKRSLLWLVAVVSLAGNVIVVTYRLFYDRGVFKKGYGVFVTNLSVSDCVMGVYLLIIASTDVRYRDEYVLHESDWRHSSLCQAAGFLSTLSSETSTFFVFLITLDRYLVIRFPFGDHWFTKLALIFSVLSAWIFGFILALVPLIYPQWIIYSSNGMCLGLPLASDQHPGWHYSFGLFICFNFILFLCIACGQIFIFRLIFSGPKFQMSNAQAVARRIQDINIAKQLFLVALSNFLCWFPICVLGFLSLTGQEVSPDTYAWLVVFVMPLNAAVNPVIYTVPVMYRKWREFKRGELTGAKPRNQMMKINN